MPPKSKEPLQAADESELSQLVEYPTQLFVQRTFGKKEQPPGEPEVIAVHRFATPPAVIEFKSGLTLNLGNFESARIDVGISVPTYREEISGAFEFAKQFVVKRIKAEVEEIRGTASKKKSEDPF